MARTWRATARITVPIAAEVEPADEVGGLPKRFLGFYPIFDTPFTVPTANTLFSVSPFVPAEERKQASMAYASALAFAEGAVEEDALDSHRAQVAQDLEALTDQLSFLWTFPVSVRSLEFLDLTAPVMAGDERAVFILPNYLSAKDMETTFQAGPVGARGALDYAGLSDQHHAALRWYALGLRPAADPQRFMAFWIAVEILSNIEGSKVKLPYRASCGHEIPECPACGTSTTRAVGGEQLKSFLVSHGGLTDSEARLLWKARQMMHGQNRLTAKALADLPERLSVLWRAAVRALAVSMGVEVSGDWTPGVGVGNFELRGRRIVEREDLEPLRPTFEPFAGKSMVLVGASPRRVEIGGQIAGV